MKSIRFKKKAARKIFWHGTNFRNLRSILKKGLLPGSQKVFQEEIPSDARGYSISTYGGIYFSDNWLTAKGSATTASGPRNPSLMVGAILETKSPEVLPDEDDLMPFLTRTLGASSAQDLMEPSSVFLGDLFELSDRRRKIFLCRYPEYLNFFEGYNWKSLVDKFWSLLLPRFGSLAGVFKHARPKVDRVIAFSLRALIYHFLQVFYEKNKREELPKLLSYLKEETSDFYRERYKTCIEIISHPSPKITSAFQILKVAVNGLSRLLKSMSSGEKGSFRHNLRVMRPLGYRGKDRILCVVGMFYREDHGYDLVFYYGLSLKELFLKPFQEFWGTNYRILDRTGSVIESSGKNL